MPRLVVVYSIERSSFDSSAPNAADINRAFRQVGLGFGLERSGGWVSPSVRITRRLVTTTTGDHETHAAALYQFPDTAWTTEHLSYLKESLGSQVQNSLRAVTGSEDWGPVEVNDWTAAANGPRDWWASGRAAVTRTRNDWPTGAGRLESDENPTGPSTERSTSPGLLDIPRQLASSVMPLVWIAGAVLLLPVLISAFQRSQSTRSTSTAPKRKNPFIRRGRGGRRRRRANGRPHAWAAGPDVPYTCSAKWVGASVPGRAGGYVKSCATPRREQYATVDGQLVAVRGAKGQYWIVPEGGLPGIGWTMPKARVGRRMKPRDMDTEYKRDARSTDFDLAEFVSWRDRAKDSGEYLPQPTELEFPHAKGSSVCDWYHPLWQEQREALSMLPPDWSLRAKSSALKDFHPKWGEWESAEAKCVKDWQGRVARRAERGGATDWRTVRAKMVREARDRGVDTGAAEFKDELAITLDGMKRARRASR